MKKKVVFLIPILIFAIALGCSKDNSAPTYSPYDDTSSPENVNAVYDSSEDEVNVSWSMSDTTGVFDFFFAVSDSSIFDEGNVNVFYWKSLTDFESLVSPLSCTYPTSVYVPAEIDSLILYFTVSAVYKNETFNSFIGPRAEIDSALVFRK